MTDKEIFKEIWSIEDLDVRAKRMDELSEQNVGLAARIDTLLGYSRQFLPVLDDPLMFFSSPALKHKSSRYSVTSELGKGGMGVVYAAYDSKMRRDVVLKCLQLKHRNNFQAVQRFYNEAHITGRLQHPGIAPVYELGELEDGRPFYCMKLVEGKTLAQFLADRESPSVDTTRALNFFLQICQTMAFAHERGIVHRDLKPSNIMVGKHGLTQVMDWGVAKRLVPEGASASLASGKSNRLVNADESRKSDFDSTETTNSDLTRHGQIVGTVGYMSPEQSQGQNELINKQSDVYSLGAILCEILTGVVPGDIADRSTDRRESALIEFNERLVSSNVDREISDLVRSCLQPEPENRLQDADAVGQVMLGYFSTREDAARATQIKLEKELTRNEETRKRRFLAATCVAACLGILLAGIVGTSIGFYKESVARASADEKAKDARAAKNLAVKSMIAADDSKAKAEVRLDQLRIGNEILGSVFDNLHPLQRARSGQQQIDLLIQNLDKAAEQLNGNSIGAPDVVASFQTKIGKCYRALGYEEKAIPLFRKAHDYSIAELGIENKITQDAKYRLAEVLLSVREVKQASLLLEDLQKYFTEKGKTDTPQALRLQILLSTVYLVEGKETKALDLVEAKSERGLEVLGVEYAVQLAKVLNANRLPKKSIEVLNSAIAKREGDSEIDDGENEKTDLGVEAAKVYLVRSYLQLDQPREAIPILEELFPSLESRYGNSPSMNFFAVCYSFGKALQGVGRYRESISYLQRALQLTDASSGPLSKRHIFPKYWLVEAYVKTGDFSKALEIAKEIHRDRVKTSGAFHIKTSLCAEKLAEIYMLINQPEKAKEHLDTSFTGHRLPRDNSRRPLGRKRFWQAVLAANQGDLLKASEGFKRAQKVFVDMVYRKTEVYPSFFDSLGPLIWRAETLALLGDEEALHLIEGFESRIKRRSTRRDELIVPGQQLFRACVVRYIVKPDETLLLRLKEVILILEKERLIKAQSHLLQEARSLLGMVCLKLGKTAKAKELLESSLNSLQSIDTPLSTATSQATVDAAMRLSHFYSLNNEEDEAQRIVDSIKAIESNADRISAFSRSLIAKTLTTDSK